MINKITVTRLEQEWPPTDGLKPTLVKRIEQKGDATKQTSSKK